MDELKQIMNESNIKIIDMDSIIDFPPYQGVALSKHTEGQELLNNEAMEQQLEKFLAQKEVFLEFGFDSQQIEVFLAKKSGRVTSDPKSLKERLLILENFNCLNKALRTIELYEYSNNYLYAACCLKKERERNNETSYGIVTFLTTPGIVGYTKELLLEKYPLTEEKMKLMEKIHNVKKAAKSKSGGVSL